MGAVMAITMGSTAMQIYHQNKALEAQGRANAATARSMVASMNRSFMNYEQQRRDIFEATVEEVEQTQLQSRRLTSSVAAAVAEGLQGGGRTADLLVRSSEADKNRAVTSVKDNYRRKSNEIDLNKEATLLNTKAQISGIREVHKPSFLGTLMQFGTAYLGARQQQESIDLLRKQNDVDGNRAYVPYAPRTYTPTTIPSLSFDMGDKVYKAYNQPFNFVSYFGKLPTQAKPVFDFTYKNPFSQDKQMINPF